MVGKLHEPVASEAMSGRRCSIAPRSSRARPRPPVENCTMMSGQCRRIPSWKAANFSGSLDVVSSALRMWTWTSEAPAS